MNGPCGIQATRRILSAMTGTKKTTCASGP